LPKPDWSKILLFVLPDRARMTGVHHHTQLFFCWDRVSWTFLSGLPYGWDDRHVPPHPAIGWDGVLQTICLDWHWALIFLVSDSRYLGLQVWATGVHLFVVILTSNILSNQVFYKPLLLFPETLLRDLIPWLRSGLAPWV
jgi:hypothetical protein